MFSTLYIEEAIRSHPRTRKILRRFKGRTVVECRHYGELLNLKSQNFRLQKKQPALILAEKRGKKILPAPSGYDIGARYNYYFSHVLNCVYDCRYCFLQGMYQSAHSVLFVNYEDFIDNIRQQALSHHDEAVHFFSGYDGDSLALEPLSSFSDFFISSLRNIPNIWLELRTKSTQVRSLLTLEPWSQCIVAFSFTPEDVSNALEHGVPEIKQRLDAIDKLQQKGWPIGLRLDPLIDSENFEQQYQGLLQQLFSVINADNIHSVSFGAFRVPEDFYAQMARLYPEERLFAFSMEKRDGMVSYRRLREQNMRDAIREMLLGYVKPSVLFPCAT